MHLHDTNILTRKSCRSIIAIKIWFVKWCYQGAWCSLVVINVFAIFCKRSISPLNSKIQKTIKEKQKCGKEKQCYGNKIIKMKAKKKTHAWMQMKQRIECWSMIAQITPIAEYTSAFFEEETTFCSQTWDHQSPSFIKMERKMYTSTQMDTYQLVLS